MAKTANETINQLSEPKSTVSLALISHATNWGVMVMRRSRRPVLPERQSAFFTKFLTFLYSGTFTHPLFVPKRETGRGRVFGPEREKASGK